MFDKKLIPASNPQHKQHLQSLYDKSITSNDIRSIIDKKIEKVNQTVKDKIVHTVTISDYFNQLWKQPELKQNDKDTAIKKLEKIQKLVKVQIQVGEQLVASTSGNLNVLNSGFQMTPFEEFNYQEKIKGIKKHKQLDIDSDLFSNHASDKEVLHALNKPFRSVPNLSAPAGFHYTAGLYDIDETDEMKKQKAGQFVKKIKEEKKAFVQKMKQAEQSQETRELEEFERFRQREKQEQEQREKEKKERLQAHIKELKGRSEARIKETTRWEEEYKAHREKKPLFKEIEQRYKKEHLLPELQDKKKKLQELRDFHKPMVRDEILEHEKKIVKKLEEKDVERKEKIFENSRWEYTKPAYESKHHKSYADQIAYLRHQREEERNELNKKKEKVIELLQNVKDNHLPKTDPQKEMERLEAIEKLKKRKDWGLRANLPEQIDEDDEIDRKKLGSEYLRSVKEMVAKKKRKADTSQNTKNNISASQLMSDRNNSKKPGETTQSESAALKPRNYLAELRKENKIHDRDNHVDVIINNKKLDSKDKKKMLQSEVEKLEEKTRRREEVKKFRVRKHFADVDDDAEEVDMLYIKTIKAKLEMLSA